jgi:hypothetical protein
MFEEGRPEKITVFWDVMPYNLVDCYPRYKGDCCLHFRAKTVCRYSLVEKELHDMTKTEE